MKTVYFLLLMVAFIGKSYGANVIVPFTINSIFNVPLGVELSVDENSTDIKSFTFAVNSFINGFARVKNGTYHLESDFTDIPRIPTKEQSEKGEIPPPMARVKSVEGDLVMILPGRIIKKEKNDSEWMISGDIAEAEIRISAKKEMGKWKLEFCEMLAYKENGSCQKKTLTDNRIRLYMKRAVSRSDPSKSTYYLKSLKAGEDTYLFFEVAKDLKGRNFLGVSQIKP